MIEKLIEERNYWEWKYRELDKLVMLMRKWVISSTKIIEKLEIRIEELDKENKELKEYWNIEIKTCNRYREKCDELEKENEELKKENEELKEKLEKLRTDNIYEEWLYD